MIREVRDRLRKIREQKAKEMAASSLEARTALSFEKESERRDGTRIIGKSVLSKTKKPLL